MSRPTTHRACTASTAVAAVESAPLSAPLAAAVATVPAIAATVVESVVVSVPPPPPLLSTTAPVPELAAARKKRPRTVQPPRLLRSEPDAVHALVDPLPELATSTATSTVASTTVAAASSSSSTTTSSTSAMLAAAATGATLPLLEDDELLMLTSSPFSSPTRSRRRVLAAPSLRRLDAPSADWLEGSMMKSIFDESGFEHGSDDQLTPELAITLAGNHDSDFSSLYRGSSAFGSSNKRKHDVLK